MCTEDRPGYVVVEILVEADILDALLTLVSEDDTLESIDAAIRRAIAWYIEDRRLSSRPVTPQAGGVSPKLLRGGL